MIGLRSIMAHWNGYPNSPFLVPPVPVRSCCPLDPAKVCIPLPQPLISLRPFLIYLPTCTQACVGLPRWHSGKESACQCRSHRRCGFDPWIWEDSLKEEMVIHSSTLAQKTPWTEEPGGLQSRVLQGLDMTEHTHTHTHTHRHVLVAHFSRPLIFSGRWIRISFANRDWLRYYFPN